MPLLARSIRASDKRVVHDWSIEAPASRLWWGLTHPDALPQWLGELSTGTFTVGEVVTIMHAPDYSCVSQVRECEPEQLVEMTWHFPDEPVSSVRIRLTPLDGTSTRLTLTHDGLGDASMDYLAGWHTHLLYLEALLLGRPRSMDNFWTTHHELITGWTSAP